jgi:hypothetical protein
LQGRCKLAQIRAENLLDVRFTRYQDLPDCSRTVLFDELLDDFLKVWITCAKAPREPVSAALGNFVASRYYVELASLARRTDNFNV